jgi:hypothetical protein
MANFKFLAAFLLIVSGSIVNQPVAAQTISTLDFWLSFGELLTEDVLTKLANIQLPSFSLPTIPKFELPKFPEITFPDINIPEINLPEFPSFPSPQFIPITYTQPDGTPRIVYIPDPRAQSAPTPAPAPRPAPRPVPASVPSNSPFEKIFNFPMHPQPPQHGHGPNPCKCGKCLPDNVRIVVVDDCNEQKSESSESDERPIQVYQKKIKPTKCPCKKHRPHH